MRPRTHHKGVAVQQKADVCPSCGDHKIKIIGKIPATDIFAGRNLLSPLDGGYLCRCQACYLAFRYPCPGKENLDALYAQGSEDSWRYARGLRNDWRIATLWIRSAFPQGAAVLDVGCFDGGFLQKIGSGYRRYGLELHHGARERARLRDVELIANDYNDLTRLAPVYDCVTAFDMIEHVHDPATFLKALGRSTRKGGVVIVSTGNTDALTWRFMGSCYWYCTIAEHISFVNPRWCSIVAPSVGLHVEQLVRFSHSRRELKRQIGEVLKNVAYRTMPQVVAWLRAHGFGGKNVRQYAELAEHPPLWMTARDHFIVMLRKM